MSTEESQQFTVLPEILDVPSEKREEEQPPIESQNQTPQEPPASRQEENQIPSEPSMAIQQDQTPQQALLPQEDYEEFFHDPWASVTTSAPTTTPVGGNAAETRPFSTPLTAPTRRQRFTRGRLLAFAAVVLAVVVAFGGGAALLVGAAKPTTPAAPARPIQQQAAAQPTAAPTPTMMATNQNNVQQDTFQRDDVHGGWGTAPNGQMWQITTPQRAPAFSVVGNVGQIEANQVGAAYYTAVLGPALTQQNVEVSATFTLPTFNEQQTNAGVIVHWQDANDYDKAYLDGVQLILLENRGGTQTTLTKINFPALDDGTAYTIRFRATGQTLMAKAWISKQQEPLAWALLTTAGKLTSGQVGIRTRLQPGNTIQVMAFQVTV